MSNENQKRILDAITEFMPTYFVHINSVLHKCTYNGTSFNENQIKVMMTVNKVGGLTPTQLSLALNIQKGSLTTIIKSLINMGFIKKVDSSKDDRKYYLYLTEEGKNFIDFKEQENIELFNQLFLDVSEGDSKEIANGLRLITKYFNRNTY